MTLSAEIECLLQDVLMELAYDRMSRDKKDQLRKRIRAVLPMRRSRFEIQEERVDHAG